MKVHTGFRAAQHAIESRGTLTTAKRKHLPKSDFGLPGSRGYPMPDKKHARLAKSGASRAEHVGNISKSTERRIDAMADRKLERRQK